jgi:hypothetical protein
MAVRNHTPPTTKAATTVVREARARVRADTKATETVVAALLAHRVPPTTQAVAVAFRMHMLPQANTRAALAASLFAG